MSRYCCYCGRVAQRCSCAADDSPLRQLLARRAEEAPLVPCWRDAPYKRGVPPQVKRRERATLRKHYDTWHAALVQQHGERCANCGLSPDEAALVIDHVLPIAKGGRSEYANLQLLCKECNRLKGKLWVDCRA